MCSQWQIYGNMPTIVDNMELVHITEVGCYRGPGGRLHDCSGNGLINSRTELFVAWIDHKCAAWTAGSSCITSLASRREQHWTARRKGFEFFPTKIRGLCGRCWWRGEYDCSCWTNDHHDNWSLTAVCGYRCPIQHWNQCLPLYCPILQSEFPYCRNELGWEQNWKSTSVWQVHALCHALCELCSDCQSFQNLTQCNHCTWLNNLSTMIHKVCIFFI